MKNTTTGDGTVKCQEKTVSFTSNEEFRCSDEKKTGDQGRALPHQENKKTSKTSVPSSVASATCAPDQGTSQDDEGSVQARVTSSEFVNVLVSNEDGDVNVIRHVKIEILQVQSKN
uniref:Uncharacterized protein n=1 Tax=Globisporangium ultimum (strain ATCC 200006 / CBS 805.95 / DAOM BR144) TaxID=431595 RepID=K3XD70_GLOUD